MKKNIFHIVLLGLLALSLNSCISDGSALGDPDSVPTIGIVEIPEQTAVSYVGNHLTISPEITTTYDDSQLQYTWYLYVDKEHSKDGFRQNIIGTERNLDYEVNLPSGVYVVALEVKVKESGLAQYARANLNVSTAFSNGFYVLKETADGNTELDFLLKTVKEKANETDADEDTLVLMENLLEKFEAPMKGKPVSLAMLYQQDYVNPDANQMEKTNMIHLFTTEDYRAYRTEDMKQVFDRSNVCYAGEDNDDVYYNVSHAANYGVMLSKKGVSCFQLSASSKTTGKLTLPIKDDDVTPHIQMLKGTQYGMAYWSNELHGVRNLNKTCNGVSDLSRDTLGRQECIASGVTRVNAMTETVWFYTEDKTTNKRYLHLIDGAQDTLKEVRELAPTLHIAKATRVAACGSSASVIYAIDGRKLYAYAFDTNTEKEVVLPGVTDVDFVTNQWLALKFGDKKFNYDNLIVGTQNGDKYKLYFYDNLVGGAPSTNAYHIATGTGKVHSIRRCVPSKITSLVITMIPPTPIFPTSE